MLLGEWSSPKTNVKRHQLTWFPGWESFCRAANKTQSIRLFNRNERTGYTYGVVRWINILQSAANICWAWFRRAVISRWTTSFVIKSYETQENIFGINPSILCCHCRNINRLVWLFREERKVYFWLPEINCFKNINIWRPGSLKNCSITCTTAQTQHNCTKPEVNPTMYKAF